MNYIPPSHNNNVIINTNRLTKAFGNLVAVNDLHLQVMRGDVFGFLGPNGSGKTTTIRMLLGLIRPTAGRAIIFGMDNAKQLPAILQRVGAIVETPVFYPYLSGLDNLRVVAATSGMMSGKSNDRRLAEVLEIVELRSYEKLSFRQYSLGMKQRLGIAAALLADPELVLLDEPTNGLDPTGMIEIRKLIKRLSELGKTIFLSSHMLHEVQQVCNRVAILQRGNLLRQGEVSALLQDSEIIEIRLNSEEEAIQALDVIRKAHEDQRTWLRNPRLATEADQAHIILIDAPISRSSEVNKLLARYEIFAAAIHPHEGNLEDFFLKVTTGTTGGHTGMEALAERFLHTEVGQVQKSEKES
ncbi:ABC transporter ATP-binding protein [Ktedonospora formicarum]|uniref:ABC transporter ATP-binding protein n=1 Tax=Ktedonospora formicarum TaxID=2778364 RepID=A0A8J3HYP4_9CHLR|nr:ATP-binding cassette domain-containing protein [Ktedonospora formicarum]GHO43560.1 ABC transporter ATP-binding protein [Ktedonospora formicarum]